MSSQSQTQSRWATRRAEKHRRLAQVASIADGMVLPTERIVDVLKMIIDIDPARPTVEVWFRGLTTSFIETIGGIDFHGLENLFGIGISQGPFLFDTTSLYGNDLDLSSDNEGEKEQDEKRPQGSTGKCTSYFPPLSWPQKLVLSQFYLKTGAIQIRCHLKR